MKAGQVGVVVLDQTPFYAESGGQVGDQGTLWVCGAPDPSFCVEDTQKIQPCVFGHYGQVANGSIKVGDRVSATVNEELRAATARNHSATHLLHKALRDVLGDHVAQKGSLVDAEKTRFDFAHHSPLSAQELQAIEEQVNAQIVANQLTQAQEMALDAAKATGAVMLFGEKYADTVRVLTIGNSCAVAPMCSARATLGFLK
jgi:alanyl-tRNA synthetase